jgi:hypothetical protein
MHMVVTRTMSDTAVLVLQHPLPCQQVKPRGFSKAPAGMLQALIM